jgi:hypothetical protein
LTSYTLLLFTLVKNTARILFFKTVIILSFPGAIYMDRVRWQAHRIGAEKEKRKKEEGK